MQAIYNRSLLNIAAAKGSNESSGIFRSMDSLQSSFSSNAISILDTRGWLLQEQLLSPRLLSYNDENISWSCLQTRSSEDYPAGMPSFFDENYLDEDTQGLRMVLGGLKPLKDGDDSTDLAYWLWRRAVTGFTMRDLTMQSDRLVAMQGVTAILSSHLNDEFIAGISRNRLAEHLAWWVCPEFESEGFGDDSYRHQKYAGPPRSSRQWKYYEHTRPRYFRAPTCSWGSVLGPITYSNPSRYSYPGFADFRRSHSAFEGRLEARDISVQTYSEGKHISGRLSLRGALSKVYLHKNSRLHRLYVAPGTEDPTTDEEKKRRYSLPGSENQWEHWWPDIPLEFLGHQRECKTIYCFHLGNGSQTNNIP